MTMKGFITKRANQKGNSDFSFVSERREKTRLGGFTLVETMIAVTILTLAAAGPLFTASRALVASQTARSQLTASYLAQEGIEYARAMRDGAYLVAYSEGGSSISTEAWNDFTEGSGANSIASCRTPVVCSLDPTLPMGYGSNSALYQCSGGSCTPLYLLDNGVYTQRSNLGGTQTQFTRTFQSIPVSETEEKIVSRVSWTFHGSSYSVTSIVHLTPWQ